MKIVKVDRRHLDYQLHIDNIVPRFEKKFGRRTPIRIRLGLSSTQFSSGRAWIGFIRLHAGRLRQDFEHVLLHELAHQLGGSAHNEKFYKDFKKVIRWAKFDMEYSISREADYKPRNSKAMTRRK